MVVGVVGVNVLGVSRHLIIPLWSNFKRDDARVR